MNQNKKPELLNLRDDLGLFQYQVHNFKQGSDFAADEVADSTITIDDSGPFVIHFSTTQATNLFTINSWKVGNPATYTIVGQPIQNNAITETLANSPIQAFIGVIIPRNSKLTMVVANGSVVQPIRIPLWGYRYSGFWYQGVEY